MDSTNGDENDEGGANTIGTGEDGPSGGGASGDGVSGESPQGGSARSANATRPPIVRVRPKDEIAREAAEVFARAASGAIAERGRFAVALAGGSTPRALYELLAAEAFRDRVDWPATHIFFGDERCVPPDSDESNFRMANEALLSRVPVRPENVHRMRGESADADAAARAYEDEVRAFVPFEDELPAFDLVLLGMGPDGHTASLFPGTDAVGEAERLVVAPWVAKFRTHRITLTPPVLRNAREVLFLVAGEDKAPALASVLEGAYEPDEYPAQVLGSARGRVTWLVDPAAAGKLYAREG